MGPMKRRTLIKTGVAGAALLALAGTTALVMERDPAVHRHTVLSGVIPALLEGALPIQAQERAAAIEQCIEAVGITVSQLSPGAQKEVAQLFALLSNAAGRRLLAGLPDDWHTASVPQVSRFLQTWRTHSNSLFRTGYQALHDLVLASWYADPAHWARIGYVAPQRP